MSDTADVVVIGAGGAGLRAAIAAHDAGAERLILCDTNGGTLPGETVATIEKMKGTLPDSLVHHSLKIRF